MLLQVRLVRLSIDKRNVIVIPVPYVWFVVLTASSYDIRYVALTESSGAAQRLERLRDDFNSCSTLAYKGLPLNAGLTENILATLGLGDDSKLFVVALKVFDDVGYSSDLSNIVIVNFQQQTTTPNPPSDATTPLTPLTSATTIVVSTSSEKHSLKLSLVQLILIICAAVAVTTLIFIGILCLVLQCKRSARGHHRQSSDVELRGTSEESGIKPDVTRRPEPDGQVGNKYDDVEKRISCRMINRFSRFVRNNRPSGVYETTIVSADMMTSDDQPPAGITDDFTNRIGPEGCFPGAPPLRPVKRYARSPAHIPVVQVARTPAPHAMEPNERKFVQNPVENIDRITPPQPVGYNDRMFTPNPEGNVDRTKQQHPVGTDTRTVATNPVRTIDRLIAPHPTGNTHARTFDRNPALSLTGVEEIPENDSTSSDDYDDVVVARRSSSGSDYQDNVIAPTTSDSLGERKPPVGADKDTDTPESPPQIPLRQSKTNQPRDSWAIDRSSLYQQIGADDNSGYRTAQVAPNMGVFASPASSRFMQPLDPTGQPRDWSRFPTSRPR